MLYPDYNIFNVRLLPDYNTQVKGEKCCEQVYF